MEREASANRKKGKGVVLKGEGGSFCDSLVNDCVTQGVTYARHTTNSVLPNHDEGLVRIRLANAVIFDRAKCLDWHWRRDRCVEYDGQRQYVSNLIGPKHSGAKRDRVCPGRPDRSIGAVR